MDTIDLRDGGTIGVRPIEPGDKPLLRAAFENMSEESRRRRFMGPADELSDEDLIYLTEVDHRRHEALVGIDPESGAILGAARWFRRPGQREVAELAVAVVDDWQGRGIGSGLVAAINERARAEGIDRYHAIVSADNVQVIEALERHGAIRSEGDESGTFDFEARVPSEGEGLGAGIAEGLRAAARGQLRLAEVAAGWLRGRVRRSRDS